MTTAEIGMVGLGTMGRNLLLNVAENGFGAAGYDLDVRKGALLLEEGRGLDVSAAENLPALLSQLATPRTIMLLVPAGGITDTVIEELTVLCEPGDLIIDGGNSHYLDTDRREAYLATKGLGFLGVGISGGEKGARTGPSIMPGGRRELYQRVEPLFRAIAAKVHDEPCVAYMGTRSAGHFVKMVHNGIEYAMMQILAEAFDLMNRAFRMPYERIARVFADWNNRELESYLVEISAAVLMKEDYITGQPVVEMILDTAGQKGTGGWTSRSALDLGVAIPTIDAAVTMRQISAQKHLRRMTAERFDLGDMPRMRDGGLDENLRELEAAVRGAFIASYAQGMTLLQVASQEFEYGLNLAEIARIWRGGCIIRSALLTDIREAFEAQPDLPTLMLDPDLSRQIGDVLEDWRYVTTQFVESPVPGMAIASALFYTKAAATERLPANLIQAQRDYFGAHTYQRTDKDGVFHTDDW
ncbi:MAG: NADP-dependent phosphogluconate dehydrogenase [Blastocatellia bacterium]|nr:NADP-dependent phosphogluconate dehydrogenase [Blastocatellia bacterium]